MESVYFILYSENMVILHLVLSITIIIYFIEYYKIFLKIKS